MFILRLFHRDRPFEQIEARLIGQDRLSLGRDPTCDWVVDDPEGTLSRLHCLVSAEGGALKLVDRSTNGVFLEGDRRAPFDTPVALAPGDAFRMGALTLLVEAADVRPVDPASTMLFTPGGGGPSPMAEDWVEPPPATSAHRDASLIEAFCEGARLDASALSSEDPVDLMRRVGAIYQQTILGLAALMADRARVKGEHQLDRTTIATSDNNPFKWAPSRKLAEDLLCGRETAFLSDAAAVRASFEDVARHLAGVVAGAEAATALVSETLAPEAIEAEARARASLLRSRAGAAWDVLRARHARLSGAEPASEGSLRRAFADAYERSQSRIDAA